MTEPEAVLRVHRSIPTDVLHLTFNDRSSRAIPDCYYCGPSGALWVEYKLIKDVPKRWATPALTALQERYLERLHNLGQKALVVIMTKTGGWALVDKPPYKRPVRPEEFSGSRQSLARALRKFIE